MKWLIDRSDLRTKSETEAYWSNVYDNHDYENVWSVTNDPVFNNYVVQKLTSLNISGSLAIPGCGSKSILENTIAEKCPQITEIIGTDFQRVIAHAAKNSLNPKINYKAIDTENLPQEHKNYFSAGVVVNSILSDSDAENRKMIQAIFESLKPGGYLLGFFPTVFASVDLAYLEKTRDRLDLVNIQNSTIYEPKQNATQIFYTPLRLRSILKNTGYDIVSFEIYFCDSEHFIAESKDHYSLEDEDLVIYEHFVICQKPL